MSLTTPIAPGYLRNLAASVAVQLFLLTVGSLLMDGGQVAQFAAMSLLPYWIMALVVMLRRGKNPSHGDLVAIRYGYLFVFAGVVILSMLRWKVIGL